MPTDVIIDPSTGQIYWNDSTGSPQSISIKGDAVNAISFVGYSGSFSPGSTPAGAQTLVTVNDNSGTDALVPGTSGFNLGSSTLRWNTFATNANLSGTLVVSDSTISSSLLTGSTRINGGIAISGNASIGQSLNFYNTAATFYTGFRAGTISANTLYTLPTAFPGSASLLQSDASGTLSWVGSIGTATTATNVNVVSASTSASHPVLFTPASGTASGAAVSTESTFVYNPSTDILSVSGLNITGSTASTSPTTGALTVNGGVGISGRLSVGDRAAPSDVYPFSGYQIAGFAVSVNNLVNFVIQNANPNAAVDTRLILANNLNNFAEIKYASSSPFFSFPNALTIRNQYGDVRIETGSGKTIQIRPLYVDEQRVTISPFGATPSTSTSTGALVVSGGVGIAKTSYFGQDLIIQGTTGSASTTTGALVVTGGVGIGGSLFTSSSYASSISGVVLNNGAITNTGTITSTGVMSLSNSSTTALSIKDGSNNTKFNVDTIGGIVSVLSSIASTSTASGALVVTGGVGIGGSLYVASATAISGVTINAGVITGNLTGTATTAT